MKKIKLTKNKYALVDDDDYDFINSFKWFFISSGYAARNTNSSDDTNKKTIMMHRVIMNTPDNLEPDHIDRNKLNNQKSNLRNVTRSKNSQNHSIQSNNKSGIKGVSWYTSRNIWRVTIKINGVQKHVGYFKTLKEAKEKRILSEKKYWDN